MPAMNGGQALIFALQREGIHTVFGVPGAGQYEAIDALYQAPSIRYISVRHEQAATYMADGYARASGQIAAALLVPGPGLYNATAGIATAYASSSPMLVITGSRNPTTPQADSDELAVMQRLTKWSAAARSTAEIPRLVHEAVRQLQRGRPGPVGLEISPRIFATVEGVDLTESIKEEEEGVVDPDVIVRTSQLLLAAERPLLWVGAGVQRAAASASLLRLAEHLQIPVVTSRQGKGSLSDRHPLALGFAEQRYAPLRNWLAQRDLIVAVGTSETLSGFGQQMIRIDANPLGFGERPNVLPVTADAKIALDALYEIVKADAPRSDRTEAVQAEVKALNLARFDPNAQLRPQWPLMMATRNALPDDGILVQGMNQMGYYSRNYFPTYAPRAYLTASSHGTLGCAFPLALGAKAAQPTRAVVALSGDGGFLYNAQELATAVQYGINVVVIVFNDHAYGNVLRAQEEEFDGRIIGTKLHNPNFVQLAQNYGARGILAEDAEQLEAALVDAFSQNAPTLIEVPVGPMERVY